MKKLFNIKNRKGLTIRGIIEYQSEKHGPLIIMCHGYRVHRDQEQVKVPAAQLVKLGYTVVRIDATNSTGKSDGELIDFTVGGYIEDIKIVINYSLHLTKQKTLVLIGYSIGALACYIITSKDKRIKGLVLQGPVYDLGIRVEKHDYFKELKAKGWYDDYSGTLKRKIRMGIAKYNEGKKYKPKKYLTKISCLVLLMYGTKEEECNKKMINILYKKLRIKDKMIKRVPGAYHTLRTKKVINFFVKEVLKWLNKPYENQT